MPHPNNSSNLYLNNPTNVPNNYPNHRNHPNQPNHPNADNERLFVHFLQKSNCKCSQNGLNTYCLSDRCISFVFMWMAPWQRRFFLRNHLFSTVFIDGTGQVNSYGYSLVTIMVINPENMRGIPIAHMIAARSKETLLARFLKFVKTVKPSWTPQLIIIDKDLSEFNGIRIFAAEFKLVLNIFFCFFHTKQAVERWMLASKNAFPESLRDKVPIFICYPVLDVCMCMCGASNVHYSPTPTVLCVLTSITCRVL